LFAAEGKQNQEIARLCAVTRRTASLWRRRFVEKRIAGMVHHNHDPKPYIWTKSAKDILEKITRTRQALLKGASV
jgi:transposase